MDGLYGGFAPDYLVVPGGKAAVPSLTARPPRAGVEVDTQPYITHLLHLGSCALPLLVFGTSTEDAINVLDLQHGPGPGAIRKLHWRSPGDGSAGGGGGGGRASSREDRAITALIAAPPTAPSSATLYTPSKSGKMAIWDLRGSSAGAPVGELVGTGGPNPTPMASGSKKPQPTQGPAYLCAAASENGWLLAAGTELRGFDAIIDIWDIRSPAAPLFTYTESHSDDVSSLAFCPSSSSSHPGGSGTSTADRSALLLSGATDGLLSIFNTAFGRGDEDNAVVRVQNVGASLARVGWGGIDPVAAAAAEAEARRRRQEGDASMDVSADEDDEAARALAACTPTGLGGVWGVTDMQTLSVFDADSFDNTTLNAFPIRSRTSLMPAFEPDYVIDMWSPTRLPPHDPHALGLSLWEGDPNGNFSLVRIPPAAVVGEAPEASARARPEAWELGAFFPSGARAHTDIVRCVEYDGSTQTLITGGEDGRICFWSLGEDGSGAATATAAAQDATDTGRIPVGSFQAAAPGAGGPRHTVFGDDGTPMQFSSPASGAGGASFSGKARREKALIGRASGGGGGGGGGQHAEVGGKGRYRPF
ncbi:hypothetical protein OC844_001285 [Tilletia horrida]|nr:hypothetical protein OC844_001285 [Tilletia horrida]